MDTINKPQGKANTIWTLQVDHQLNTLTNWENMQAQVAQVACLVDDHFDSWTDINRNDPHKPAFFEEHKTMRNYLQRLEADKEYALRKLNERYDNINDWVDMVFAEAEAIRTLQPILDMYNEALNLM